MVCFGLLCHAGFELQQVNDELAELREMLHTELSILAIHVVVVAR